MSARFKRWSAVAVIATVVPLLLLAGQSLANNGPTPEELAELGEHLYFDQNLSTPKGQACADCHLPSAGFDDPDSDLPVSAGVLPHRFGDRNSPASAYAMYAPSLYWDADEGLFIGGQFWDGRATGEVLGDPLADQALGPFLNPVEMANPVRRTVINSIKHSDYADRFEQVWGERILKDTDAAYEAVALSIAAFERTALFGEFSSKYDHYLQACLDAGGDAEDCAKGTSAVDEVAITVAEEFFTEEEWAGFQLFMKEDAGGAKCVACHVADWVDPDVLGNGVVVPDWARGMIPPLFTDFTYDNLGVPKNWGSPFLYMPPNLNPDGTSFVDYGLARFLAGRPDLWPDDDAWALADENGKFKVMTLRNISLTAPYAHNGFFGRLEDITNFYNTRDVDPWPEPEVPDNVNTDELGNLGLSGTQELLLVEFMKTLTDGWEPPTE
jgi:cytochrome c peroxidase